MWKSNSVAKLRLFVVINMRARRPKAKRATGPALPLTAGHAYSAAGEHHLFNGGRTTLITSICTDGSQAVIRPAAKFLSRPQCPRERSRARASRVFGRHPMSTRARHSVRFFCRFFFTFRLFSRDLVWQQHRATEEGQVVVVAVVTAHCADV